MKPKTKPKIKESIEQLEAGQSVEFRMDSVKESTVRSTCSRITRAWRVTRITDKNAALFSIVAAYPTIKVTRL